MATRHSEYPERHVERMMQFPEETIEDLQPITKILRHVKRCPDGATCAEISRATGVGPVEVKQLLKENDESGTLGGYFTPRGARWFINTSRN